MYQNNSITKEACVETVKEAILAEKRGTDRVELCDRLEYDGLTPTKQNIEKLIGSLSIPIKVMIRPRKGNFIYNEKEIMEMESKIEMCKNIGITEVVFGLLKSDKNIDYISTERLVKKAYPMSVTFHKAIDITSDILNSIERLVPISGITSILSSGGEKTAYHGKERMKVIINRFRNRFNVIVAGSITESNLTEIHNFIGAKEYHGRKIVGNLI
ncbi:MAG: copper homeostasis protein CutC [Candidatus Neomarinimicrobiota bacterium]|nr:copper homeostasis protein CutC [Candidatus Neomarinimicrobiota bacterium]